MRPKFAFCLLLSALPAGAGELTGRMTLNDRPVAGITVSAVPCETSFEKDRREARRELRPMAIETTVTNARGEWRFVFEVPLGQPGKIVEFHYAGPGVARGAIPGVWDTANPEDGDGGETALRKGATLSGRVVDGGGHPVTDAEVLHPGGIDSVRTDADGKFVLEGVAESGNDVTVRKPGYATAKVVDLRGGAATTVVLRAGLPLSGVVLAADGKTPVKGAIVRVERKGTPTFAETDSEGRFAVRELEPGRVLVAADGGERGIREVTGVAIPRPPDTLLTIVLAPAAELRGRVFDVATRKPVAGAFVDAVSGRRYLWTRSRADGSFTVSPAPSGDWVLGAVAARYVQTTRRLARAERTDKPLEIFLRAGVTISGRVTDDQRRPVAAASVRIVESVAWGSGGFGGISPAPAGAMTITATDGTFTLRRVPPVETLRLVVIHPDFEPASVGDLGLKPGETRAGVGIALRRGAVLTGVATAGEAPLAGVQVSVTMGRSRRGASPRSLAGPEWSWPHATTGTDGRFRIGGLAPGEYTVTASKTGYASDSRPGIVIAEGRGPQPLVFALGPEAIIAGSVRGKRGTGIAGQRVAAINEGSRSLGGTAETLADGTFRIEGLKPGVTYTVALLSGSSPQQKSVVAPAEGVEMTTEGTGRVEGRVIDADGRPMTDFQVTVQNDESSSGYSYVDPVKQDVSSDAGEFVVENAPAVVLEVRIVARGYQPARAGGIAVEEGQTRSGVEIKLSRGATLHGRVVEAKSGRPVPDVEVVAESATSLRAATDADGAFSIDGLPPGKVRVKANCPEYASTSEIAEVREDGGTVELKLSNGASVSAVVVSTAGEPQAGAEASLAQVGQNPYYNGTKAIAGPDGRVLFSHLSPGRYTLTAGTAGRRAKPVDVALEADQVRDDLRAVIGGGATVFVTVTGLSPDDRRQVSVNVSSRGNYTAATELPDGRFEARDVAAGQAQALAGVGAPMDSNGRFVRRAVTVPEDGTVDVELPFEAGFTLTVHVLRDGQPVDGANVYASPAIREASTAGYGTTDSSGSCRLTGLKGGTYNVTVQSMVIGSAAPDQKIDLNGDQTLEFVLPAGNLAGRVVGSGSGQPLADVQVQTRTMSADGTSGITHDATTDSSGRFRLTGLEAGPISLTAQKRGFLVETRTVTADTDQDLVIELARGDGLDVTGRDGLLGTPLETFTARVFDGAGAELPTSYVLLDSAGVGEIPSLKPGSYSIIAASRGFAPVTYDGVPVPGPALAVRLTPGGTLDIDVPAERFKSKPLVCVVSGPRGRPLAFRQWGKRGDLSLAAPSTHLANFPAVSGMLACPGFTPLAFTVTEGGATRITVK